MTRRCNQGAVLSALLAALAILLASSEDTLVHAKLRGAACAPVSVRACPTCCETYPVTSSPMGGSPNYISTAISTTVCAAACKGNGFAFYVFFAPSRCYCYSSCTSAGLYFKASTIATSGATSACP